MNTDEIMGNFTSARILKIVEENPRCRTLCFEWKGKPDLKPGQFLMVWVPGIDEIPMSISGWLPQIAKITVKNIGDATGALLSLAIDDWIGIRGPFGKSFGIGSKKALVVGGGIGMAPLRPLVYNLLESEAKVTLLIAAKTQEELVFYKEFSELKNDDFKLVVTTDDGSHGFKGLATSGVIELLNIKDFDTLYTCGPELMMAELYKLADQAGIRFQASLERFMKCGCGLCGSCALDPTGDLVCLDGPVFTDDQIKNFSDFGKYYRDSMGRKNRF